MTATPATALLRRGLRLEFATLGWNVAGTVVLVLLALRAGSPALAGFGFDSLIEIGASLVVVWELSGAPELRERRAHSDRHTHAFHIGNVIDTPTQRHVNWQRSG